MLDGCLYLSGLEGVQHALQGYQKMENTWLLCPDCSPSPRSRKNLSLEDCARKCSKNKRSFTCRAFGFDHSNRTCRLLPFDRHSGGAQRGYKPKHDLYEKEGNKSTRSNIFLGVSFQGAGCPRWCPLTPHPPE
uniref:Apple domain-containing protein n=1 Tax=Denticeps clupeoides TaxID=299321 RepID=A0AAY4DSM6_9TELE